MQARYFFVIIKIIDYFWASNYKSINQRASLIRRLPFDYLGEVINV